MDNIHNRTLLYERTFKERLSKNQSIYTEQFLNSVIWIEGLIDKTLIPID